MPPVSVTSWRPSTCWHSRLVECVDEVRRIDGPYAAKLSRPVLSHFCSVPGVPQFHAIELLLTTDGRKQDGHLAAVDGAGFGNHQILAR
jgi:hypothetical protein